MNTNEPEVPLPGSSAETSPKKKIAIAIFKYFAPSSGIQSDVIPLAEELHNRGHEVTLYCSSWDAPPRPQWLNVKIISADGWNNAVRSKKFISKLKDQLAENPADIFVAFNRIPGADFYIAGDRPVAMQNTSLLQKLSPRYRRNAALEKELFDRNSKTKILCVSPRQKLEYIRNYGTPEERFLLMPAGIPVNRKLRSDAPEIRQKVRESLGIADDQLMLLTEGVNPGVIGADRAIAAVAAMPDELLSNIRLVICCRGNLKPLKKMAQKLGVSDSVDFIAPDFDLLDLFPAADLLLYPARNETSGIAPLESIASGTPVLASPNHGWDHIVQESGSIVLPSPFTRDNLISALRVLLLTPERIEEMKRQVAEYANTADFYRRSEFAADAITGVKK